jgi:hypothetical protein
MVMNTTPKLSLIRQALLLLTAVACLTFNAAALAANITVSTSRNPVALDDSFHLIYEADSSVDGEPDFSPIYQNFDVLSSSQSTNMRSVNGNWSLKKTWDLAVIAKDIGTFTIPPIRFGKDLSPAIQIKISNSTSPNSLAPKGQGQATVPASIFLESSVDTKTAWVQSQLIYTIRLLRTVSIANASLSEPVTSDPDAIIEKLSEDNYQTTRNGIQYEVFERRYAIFPQKSGALKIDPLTFEGRVNATQPRTIFDQFRMSGQLKRLRSKAVEIQIKPNPTSLIEEWSEDIQNLKAGEPVTRTITIAAEGLTGVQLPDLKFDDVDGLKQYPDNSVIENRPGSEGITGLKQIKVALIPASAGTYILPEIKLPWWNTKTNKEELASLPPAVLTITGQASQTTMPAPTPGVSDTPVSQADAPINNIAPAPLSPVITSEPYWRWLALFFAFAWLATLILFSRKSGADSRQSKKDKQAASMSDKAAIAAVEKNAKNNDANQTIESLIRWARLAYHDDTITNLTQITEHCSTQLAQQIRRLNESIYSAEKHAWHGKDLLLAFNIEKTLKVQEKKAPPSTLKPLYSD